eukprot:gene832-9081_t
MQNVKERMFNYKMYHELNGTKPVVLPTIKYHKSKNLDRCRSSSIIRNFDEDPVLISVPTNSKEPFWIIDKNHHTKHLKICDVNCFFTHNQEYSKYSPDVFVSYLKAKNIKRTPCRHQKTMFYSMENFRYSNFDIYATTNSNSDIYSTYLGDEFDLMMKPKEKTRKSMASAYISNCNDKLNRLGIINELREYGITIDLFGKCSGRVKEKIKTTNLTRTERKLENIKHYKFHLSFENSETNGYITEKYWQALQGGTIPIYLGAKDIRRYQPSKNSILVVNEFKNIKELAEKIHHLDKNEIEYQKMLEWKQTGPSDDFLATIDYSCILNFCYWCHKIADKFGRNVELMNSGEPFLVFVREIGMFRHYPIQLKELTYKSLHKAIMFQFKDYKPKWWYCITKKYRKNLNKREIIRIHKITKSGENYDTLKFGPGIDSDKKVKELKSGSKLDVIFV